ncbi:MAG: hypothetical protein P1U89_06630 [Verrucomicrobiales bacterium]|nr:hypothetical protein [Verrucomicrobiales bacterium]
MNNKLRETFGPGRMVAKEVVFHQLTDSGLRAGKGIGKSSRLKPMANKATAQPLSSARYRAIEQRP